MKLVTISPSRTTGDRSYSHGIWQICGQNETHTAVWPLKDDFWGSSLCPRRKMFLETADHDFGDAVPLLSKAELAECLVHAKTDL